MRNGISCFKAYDVRGVVPDELDEQLAYRIGIAYADVIKPHTVAVGMDVRPSSRSLASALIRGLNDAGVHVVHIGLCGTEQVYFTTGRLGLDGGIMVTASHNPPQYNGMKMVREKSIPIGSDSGLKEIERVVAGMSDVALSPSAVPPKKMEQWDSTDTYIEHLLSYIDPKQLKPLKIVCHPGNGCAGPIVKKLASHLPGQFIYLHDEPDGTFPNGVPNPMLRENQHATGALVRQTGADIGIAWDGDFDRCFFFDERGRFIEGYYIVAMLAECMLRRHPHAKVIHDPKLTWNTVDAVQRAGGIPVQCRTGHTFFKEKMRAVDAVYGGEVSAHHYFRDFYYCDSGMIPWLIMLELLSTADAPLSEIVATYARRFPTSGEINRQLSDPVRTLERLEAKYVTAADRVDRTDGLSVFYDDWRFNVRLSNTEPLLRLNVESRGDVHLLTEKTKELLEYVDEDERSAEETQTV